MWKGADNEQAVKEYLKPWLQCRPPATRVLFKDPIALMSTEWLVEEYGFKPLVLIRHPAAFVDSIVRPKWGFNFIDYTAQPELMDELLGEWRDEVHDALGEAQGGKGERPDLFHTAVLLWKTLYGVVGKFEDRHPDWLFLRHEDLARHPVEGFAKIYRYYGLDYTPEIEARVAAAPLAHLGRFNESFTEAQVEYIMDAVKDENRWY